MARGVTIARRASTAGRIWTGAVVANDEQGAFSIFKRVMKGVYQRCGEQLLHRYLAEFEFRYNTPMANGIDDRGRAIAAVRRIVGKHLTHTTPN